MKCHIVIYLFSPVTNEFDRGSTLLSNDNAMTVST